MTQALPESQGSVAGTKVNAKRAQRLNGGQTGEYICQNCQTEFHYDIKDGKPECPSCHTTDADSLTPNYTEDDPKKDEMLGRDQFSAGD